MFNILLDAGEWSEKDLLDHLATAVMAGEDEIVKELLLRGVDPSVPLYGYLKPPLLEALVRGHNAVVDVLLADPRTDHNVRFYDKMDIHGTQTALQEAAKRGNAHMVRSLLEQGASTRPNVETSMHSAVINYSPEIV